MSEALELWGWDPAWRGAFEKAGPRGFPARVVEKQLRAIFLATQEGPRIGQCRRSFLLKAEARGLAPALGDWVVAEPLPGEPDKALIVAVLPRRTRFSRKKAGETTAEQVIVANVDVVFVVAALGLEFNVRRLERYLAAARMSGAQPVVLLNKADLKPDREEELAQASGIVEGVPAFAVSAATGLGLEKVREYLSAGRTAAFLGSSGVGKSSLINALLGSDVQAVQEVRAHDEQGKHTTSSGKLIPLPSGGVLIDTAGMRELQLWEAEEGVEAVFQEIEDAALRCRFSDCKHDTEPGCAVKEGVKDGTITRERFESWSKLQGELRHLASKQDEAEDARRKREEKIRSKAVKAWIKRNRSPEDP